MIKQRTLAIYRSAITDGGDWSQAIADVDRILSPQFDQLPPEDILKAWWDELEATRPSRLQSAALEESKFYRLEARVTDLENDIRALTDRLEKLEG